MLNPTIYKLSALVLLGLSPLNASGLSEESSASEDLNFAIQQLHRTNTLNLQEAIKLQRAASKIKAMSDKERSAFIKSLGIHHGREIREAIPEDHKLSSKTGCFAFWSSCAKVGAKAAGQLAVDLINDLSDGRLDGRSHAGRINYVGNLVNIVTEEIEELYPKKPKRQ